MLTLNRSPHPVRRPPASPIRRAAAGWALLDPPVRRALAVWALLVAGSFAAGGILLALGVVRIDYLPPFHGHVRAPGAGLLAPAAFGAAAVRFLPRLTARTRFGTALLAAYACALAWTVLLAVSGDGLAAPFTHKEEYLAVLPAVDGHPLRWLAGFTRDLPAYPTHVRGHPPLPVLVVWALDAAGLRGPLWAAVVVVAAGCSAGTAVALTVRRLAGQDAARRALPYLALIPASVWIATSMDALFAAAGAWGVALLVLGRGRVARAAGGLAAGLLLGSLPYLSYGLVPYLLIPAAVAVAVRPPRAALVAALVGAATVTAAFAWAGFLWPAGVIATHAEWAADPGAARPYLYFLVGDLAVLALVTGPATAAGLAGRVPSRVAVAVAAAVAAVLALDVSGVTRGEVERIWLPFAVWVGLAGAFAGGHRADAGTAARWDRWLLAQAVTGLLLQALVASPW
ncbi:hypothetical protein GCM10009530_42490 [Microbispora corallina]|uniref:Integral membrane protein n=1 Tax=Microbispora corallina TaxID=83302 RepID=A0ABQ4G189_9ACTN|nr:hypothetical protein [Microbispora corallina]GIH40822.1 hypothetical protein Mco01_38220 [Microbispora corallina]